MKIGFRVRVISFALCLVLLIPVFTIPISAQADELDDFNYTSEEMFVADYMCGLISPIGQQGEGSTYNYYSTQINRDFAFKNIAEELSENGYEVWASTFWNKIDSYFSADFKTAFGNKSYEQGIYEAILLDYISFQQDDTKIESEFDYETSKLGEEISLYILEFFLNDKNAAAAAMNGAAEGTAIGRKLKGKLMEMLPDGAEVVSIAVDTVNDLADLIAKYNALCNGVHARVDCIRAMKAQAEADGNTAFVNACDEVINTVEEIMNDPGMTGAILDDLSNDAAWTVFKDTVLSPVIENIICPDAATSAISLGVKILDWSIGSGSIAENNVKLLLLYITETYALVAAQNCKTNYLSNPTEDNAALLNSMYLYYIDLDQYASEYLRTYVYSAIYGGAIQKFCGVFSSDMSQLYEDYTTQINTDVNFCNTSRNAANRERDIFRAIVERSRENEGEDPESGNNEVEDPYLASLNWENLNQDITLNNNFTVHSDVLIRGGRINLNGHTLKIYGDLAQSGGVMCINGGRLKVGGDYRITAAHQSNGDSYGTLQMTNEDDYVLVGGAFVTRSYYGTGDSADNNNKLSAGTLEIKGDFTQIRSSYYSGYSSNFAPSGTHKVVLSGNENQAISFDNPNSSGFNILEIRRADLKLNNGIKINQLVISKDITINTNGSATIYNNIDFQGHNVIFNGTLNKDGGTLSLSGGKLTINGDYKASATTLVGGGELIVNGNFDFNGGTTSIGGGLLKVRDELCQPYGIMRIDGGRLEVGGDYRITAGRQSMGDSYGTLQMTNENDYVLVGGSFVTQSYSVTGGFDDSNNKLSAGTLEIKGDFIQRRDSHSSSSMSNFAPSGNHSDAV